MSLDKLPINVFDLVLVLVLLLGIWRGRKHGMSEELLGTIKWLVIVIGCAMFYAPLGRAFAQSSPFSLLASFVMVYVGVALAILALFALMKHSLGGKLIGSDIFGRGEYYLGMCSGMVRCGCMLLAALALLNARYFSPTEVKAIAHYQTELYGSNFFPGLQTVQSIVFEKSIAGPLIRDRLGFLLIHPTKPEDKRLRLQEYALPQ